MIAPRMQAWLIVSGVAGLLALGLGALLAEVDRRHDAYRMTVSHHEQRIARLEGLRQAAQELERLADRVDRNIGRFAQNGRPGEGGRVNLLPLVQQKLRDSGVSIERSQEQPRREYEGFRTERLTFVASGTLPQVVSALAALQDNEPTIRIERVVLSPNDLRGRGGIEQRVQVLLDVALAGLVP